MNRKIFHYIIWALAAILYSPVFFQLYHQRWESIDYTHAYFILPISLWLVWRKREVLKQIIPATSKISNIFSFFLIIFALLMFIFGWRQDFLFISTLSLIPLLYGLVIYFYGTNTAKTLSFPILYLLLLVPPPLGVLDSITLPMRYGISMLTQMILGALHYPITRDGLLLSIGGHEIYMGTPCSGFRSLITMISLGLVYIYVIKGTLKKKTALTLSIIPLALIGNLIRVASVCLVSFYFGESIAGKYHDASGFVIFLILIAGLTGTEALLDVSLRGTK